jgi:hypothetical protein
MPTTLVTQILSGVDLIPHVEMGALKFAMRRFAMAPRVLTLTDMQGWNTRKISDYKKVRGAQALSEATDIPTSAVNRKRLTSIDPLEWGDRYPITDRRMNTDLESILSDTIQFLGYSLGFSKEQRLMAQATAAGPDVLDGTAGNFTVNQPIQIQHEFRDKFGGNDGSAPLYAVIHPFQARDIMETLITYTGTTAGANLDFRNQAIRGWTVPGFDNMNIAVSDWVPRKVVHNIAVDATGGTFRLAINTTQIQGTDITADITYSVTPATMASNIQTAINALTGQTGWTVTGSDNLLLVATAPIGLDAESELRVGVDPNGDDYNSLTGGAGTVVLTEKSATAIAPVFQREAIVHDVRHPISAYQELVNQGRTLEVSAYETYGVGSWRSDRIMHIETVADSIFAIG